MREGQWLQIMLDQKTLKFEFHGTFTLQYSAEVLSNNTTPDLQGKKNPCPTNTPQNCDQLQNIAYGLILKKLMQNEYLISLWSAKFISGTRNVLSN